MVHISITSQVTGREEDVLQEEVNDGGVRIEEQLSIPEQGKAQLQNLLQLLWGELFPVAVQLVKGVVKGMGGGEGQNVK